MKRIAGDRKRRSDDYKKQLLMGKGAMNSPNWSNCLHGKKKKKLIISFKLLSEEKYIG